MSDPTNKPKLTPAQEFDHEVRLLVNRKVKIITVAEAVGVLTHIATQISNAAIDPAPEPKP